MLFFKWQIILLCICGILKINKCNRMLLENAYFSNHTLYQIIILVAVHIFK